MSAPTDLRQRVEALAEAAADAGQGWLAGALIDALDRADAPFEDLEPSLGAPESNLAVANARYGNVDQAASWRTPTDDLEVPDDAEPDMGWRNPEGDLPHSYREPSRTDGAYVDADGDLSGGCFGEARQ